MITLYTDGSSNGKTGGVGGWGVLVTGTMVPGQRTYSGRVENTTNNQMELMAVLEGLRTIENGEEVLVVTDSRLVIGWLYNGWQRKNPGCAAICRDIDDLIRERKLQVQYQHIKGHSGHVENEICDKLAKAARKELP